MSEKEIKDEKKEKKKKKMKKMKKKKRKKRRKRVRVSLPERRKKRQLHLKGKRCHIHWYHKRKTRNDT